MGETQAENGSTSTGKDGPSSSNETGLNQAKSAVKDDEVGIEMAQAETLYTAVEQELAEKESSANSPVNRKRLYLLCLTISLNASIASMALIGLNPMTSTLENVNEWSESEAARNISFLNALTLLGGFTSTMMANMWMKRFGRMTVTLISDICFVILGCIICVSIKSFFALAVGRVLVGYGVSLHVYIAIPYLREVSPPTIRGLIGALHPLQLALGMTCAFLLALGLPEPDPENRDDDYWRVVLLGPAFIATFQVILFALFFRKYESPKALFLQGNTDGAMWVLHQLQSPQEAKDSMNSLEVTRGAVAGGDQKHHVLTCEHIKKPVVRRPLTLAIAAISAMHFTGVTSLFVYSTDIFSSADEDLPLRDSIMNSLIYFALVSFVASFFGLFFATKYRRRTVSLTSLGFMIFFLIGIGLFDMIDILTGLKIAVVGLTFSAQSGNGGILFMYIAEILEPEMLLFPRGAHWICLIVVSLVTKPLINALSLGGFYFLYAAISVLYMIGFGKYMVETRGLKAEEIQAKFMSNLKKSKSSSPVKSPNAPVSV